MIKTYSIILFLIFTTNFLVAQSLTKFSGLAYFDYFYNIENKDISKKDLQGFQFRRVFFTADFDVTNKLSARFRLESDGTELNNVNRFYPYLKELYAQYKLDNSQLYFGLITTPPTEVEEKFWAYRSVEKIQMDLRGLVTTRDVGISLITKTSDNKNSFWIMFANNSSHGAETDKYKKIYLQFLREVLENLTLSFDANFANASGDKNLYAGRIGIYTQSEDMKGGLTFSSALQKKSDVNNKDLKQFGISIFGSKKLNSDLTGLIRFDVFEPSTERINNIEYTFIGGIDYKLEKNFNIIPNIIYNKYENKNFKSDLAARITFYYQF